MLIFRKIEHEKLSVLPDIEFRLVCCSEDNSDSNLILKKLLFKLKFNVFKSLKKFKKIMQKLKQCSAIYYFFNNQLYKFVF